jgi:hypothetical protein
MQQDFYKAVVQEWCPGRADEESLVTVFGNVRDIPYGSTGDRDPEVIVKKNLGSCSGKHLLLSNLLRTIGYETEIVTCYHHFEEVVPHNDTYPDRLKAILRNQHVVDFHHFVRVKTPQVWLNLDATWDSALKPFGFPANVEWGGRTDTQLAVRPMKFYPPTDDVISLKVKLISEMPRREARIRAEFLRLLTQWLIETRKQSQ